MGGEGVAALARRPRPREASTRWSCPAGSPTATTCAAARSPAFAPLMEEIRAFADAGGPVLGHLQRLPDPLRGRAAAGRADPQRVARGSCAVNVWLRVETSQTLRDRRAGAGRDDRGPDQARRGAVGRDGRAARARRGRGTGRVPVRAPDGVVERRVQSERRRRTTSPACATSAGNVVGLMPHPEHAVDPDVGPTGGQSDVRLAPSSATLAGPGVNRVSDDRCIRPLGCRTTSTSDRRDAGPRAEPRRARDVLGDVVGALLVQVLEGPSADASPPRARGAGRPGRGRGRRWTSATAMACVFKMESHSHPSAIEPYQGAATGVGGIVRDILAMGARPVALLDPLRFGPADRAAEPVALRGGGRRHRRVRQLHRGAHGRGRDPVRRPHSSNPTRERHVRRASRGPTSCPRRSARRTRARPGALSAPAPAATGSAACRCSPAPRSRTDGDGGAAERADRRPVRGEAPDRGVPRAASSGAARGAAGPRRGRDHVRRQRVGGAGRDGRGPGPRRRRRSASPAWSPSRS